MTGADVVRVNVGGKRFETSRETVLRSRYLTSLLNNPNRKPSDELWVDRDGRAFRRVLNVMRKTERPEPELAAELAFYGVLPYEEPAAPFSTHPTEAAKFVRKTMTGDPLSPRAALLSYVVTPYEGKPNVSEFLFPVTGGHVRRLWLDFCLDYVKPGAKTASFAASLHENRLWSFIERIERCCNGLVLDSMTGPALRAHYELQLGWQSHKPLIAQAEREANHRISLGLPLLRDVDPESSGVDASECWMTTHLPQKIVVHWRAHPSFATVRDPRLRIESALPNTDRLNFDRFEFPVEQWQESAFVVSNRVPVEGGGTRFEVNIPFNHTLRRLLWTVTVNGAATRIRGARFLDRSPNKAVVVYFDMDEIALLQRMADHGQLPKMPTYCYDYGSFGYNMSRIERACLEITLDPTLPDSSEIVCNVFANVANTLVVVGGSEVVKFSS